jgi:two-component system LytT family response regulator
MSNPELKLTDMLRTLIIDDESHIRDTLGKLLRLCCPEVEIIGEASGVATGISLVADTHPDLVFLDINLNDGTGYDFLHAFDPVTFRVIFISSFDRRTAQAFKLSNMTYLMKPISPTDLIEAIRNVGDMDLRHFNLYLEALEDNLKGN